MSWSCRIAHLATLTAVDSGTLTEMMQLAQRVEGALEGIYHPEGYNVGMNIGRAAGAGIAGHLHLHVLPRWIGDTNFMTTIAETRVLTRRTPNLQAAPHAKLRQRARPRWRPPQARISGESA